MRPEIRSSKRCLVFSSTALLAALFANTHALGDDTDPMVIFDNGNLKARMHLQAGVNAVSERNLFWNLSNIFAPAAQYDADKNWIEYYIKPGISFEYSFPEETMLYGKASLVASYTQGKDAFDAGDSGRITLEEAYLGIKKRFGNSVDFDASVGARELKLGTGMLIANGGSSGFERGALKFGPRKAWEMSAIGRLSYAGATGTIFYIDPNEIPSKDNGNELAGVDLRFDSSEGGFLGGTFIHVLRSNNPYPQAAPGGIGPPVITPGARDGLNTINFYGRTDPFENSFGTSFIAIDGAFQWSSNIDMAAWAGRFQAGHTFSNRIWTPSLTYTFKTFSGDDPNTSRQERFDPLYYDGSPSTWATGSKSSMTFINSNVNAHEVAFSVKPSVMDTITLRYAHIRANELRSPIQFGQATRFDLGGGTNIVTGVTHPHLADDVFLEYNRIINRNTYLTLGISGSKPGKGLELAAGRDLPIWYGGFANLVVNY